MIRLDHQDDAVGTGSIGLAGVLPGYPVNDLPCSIALDTFHDPATDQRRGERLINIGDRDRHSGITLEIASLARARSSKNYEIVTLEVYPYRHTVWRAVGHQGRDVSVVRPLDKPPHVRRHFGHRHFLSTSFRIELSHLAGVQPSRVPVH